MSTPVKPRVNFPTPTYSVLWPLLIALHLHVASAQSVAPGSSTETAPEIVILSPFVVTTEKDEGWIASSTLVGNRTNESLSNVPMTVDALTAEFIQDMGAYTIEDAGRWIANLDVVSNLERKTDDQRLNYRGMEIGDRESGQASRNFFLWYAPTDNYNVDRIDFNKGSNSLMFGDASPGGQATVYTKRARFTNRSQVAALFGSYDSYRLMLDVNRKLTKKLAVRLNLLDRSDGSYIDFSESKLRAIHGAVSYQPFSNTLIRFEAEAGEYERTRALNQVTILENSAPGRGFGQNNRWYYTSDGDIIRRTSSSPASIDRTAAGGAQLSLLEGQTVNVRIMSSSTAFTGTTVPISGYSRSVNLLGTRDFLDRPYTNFSTWIEQRIGGLNMELSYNQQNQRQLRNDADFGTTISVDRTGRPYVDSEINKRTFGNRVRTGRFTASYEFEPFDWMSQYLVFVADRQEDFAYSFRQNLANFANPTTNIANERIVARAYLDDPGFPSRTFYDQFRPENLPVTSNFRADWYETTDANRPFADYRYQRSQSISAKGTYFGGRIHTLLGVRFDKFDRKRITDLPQDAIGQFIYLGDADTAPEAYTYDPAFNLNNTTYTGGLVYQLRKGVNLYGTYSESFRWQGYTDFTGNVLGPVLGKTKEIGVKTSLLGDMLFATFAVYEVERQNARFVWSPNNLSTAEMEDLFNPNDLAPGSPGYFVPATGINLESRTVTSNEKSEGYEATFQLKRIHGVQARLTFAHNKIRSSRDLSLLRDLTDAAIQRTQQALAPGGNPALAESQAIINDALSILSANEGVETVSGTRGTPNSINWALDYEFPKGRALGGTRLAVFGNWRDDYIIENLSGVDYRGGASHSIGMYLIHKREVFGQSTTFRLGVSNLADFERSGDSFEAGVSRLDSDGNPQYQFRYTQPTTWDFTITLDL